MKIGHQLGLLMIQDYLVGFMVLYISGSLSWTLEIVYFYLDFLDEFYKGKFDTKMHFLIFGK